MGFSWRRSYKKRVVERLAQIKQAAKDAQIPVFYSPHYYLEGEYQSWKHLNVVEKVMFERKMFNTGTWGAKFHPKTTTR